jgi:hypothetical protein
VIDDEIVKAAEAVSDAYERLVLVVGQAGSGKSTVLHSAAVKRRWPVLNLSLGMAEKMLQVSVHQRPAHAFEIALGLLREEASPVVCLDNIELLFEPSLQLDPLGLLQSLSKQRTLAVAWPGRIATGDAPRLIHAERPHPEYCDYSARGLVLLSVPAA